MNFPKFKKKVQKEEEFISSIKDILEGFTQENLKQIENIKSKQSKINLENEEILETLYEIQEKSEGQNKLLVESKRDTKKLLNLVLLYQEYFELIQMNIKLLGNDNIHSQINVMNAKLTQSMNLAGMITISNTGDFINTNIHEIVGTEMTDEVSKVDTVKSVLVPGCVYKGEVLRKAKVIANVQKKESNVWQE